MRSPGLERRHRTEVYLYALLRHLGAPKPPGGAAALEDVCGGQDDGDPEKDGGGDGHGHLRHEHEDDQRD